MLNRRSFSLAVSAQIATASIFSGVQSSRANTGHSSGKLRVAFIGVGGRGGGNLKTVASDPRVEVAAVCDVDSRRLAAAKGLFPNARQYTDFRKLYEDESLFDAVVVSTAEHTHAYATMPALKLGKHVYCEKPLTHNIYESRKISEAAEVAGVATQMGTQIHAGENYHRVVAAIQSGMIGPVGECHVWVNRAWGLQSEEAAKRNKDIVFVDRRPAEQVAVPDSLDWDLWLGPAPYRPFHPVYFPGPKWYRWWDFGSGTMSDLGSHWNDLPFWALQLDAPNSIHADGPPAHPELAPATMSAHYEYDALGVRPAVQLSWYQGEMKPKIWSDKRIPQWSSGCLFIGSEKMLLSDYGKHVIMDLDGKKLPLSAPRPAYTIPSSHHADWIDSCFSAEPTASPFSYAGPLTEANHLGNVAYRLGEKIQWDREAMSVGKPAAQALIRRPAREGWTL
jgi:hypothetical protein